MSEKESTLPTSLTGVDSLENYENNINSRATLRGDHLTWGHTPFYSSPEQFEVYTKLIDRIVNSAPEETPAEIQDYVLMHFMSRFYKRQDRNNQSYEDRLNYYGALSEMSLSALDSALAGDCVRPVDLLVLRDELGMPSIELARLTHPYGKDMDLLPEMQTAVGYAVETLGGEICLGDECITYGVDGAHVRNTSSGNAEVGFLVKRKKLVGVLPDKTRIIERSSYFLRIDNDSRLDQVIAQSMRNVVTQTMSGNVVENMYVLNICETKDWQTKLMESGNLNELMPLLLKGGDFNDVAIPLSTTIYAYNPDCVEAVAGLKRKEDPEED